MRRLLPVILAVLLGMAGGSALTLLVLSRSEPQPLRALPARPGSSNLTVTLDREVFLREVARRALPVLGDYDLRDPAWRLNDDNTITLDAIGKAPLIGTDVAVRLVSRPVVRDGALAVEVLNISYGQIQVSGSGLSGLAEDLNEQLEQAIDRVTFRVAVGRATGGAVTLRVRVVGERATPAQPTGVCPAPDLCLDRQAVVRQLYALGQQAAGAFMLQLVPEMNEIRALRPDAPRHLNCLLEAQVQRVRLVPQGVEHQDVHPRTASMVSAGRLLASVIYASPPIR